MGQYGGGVSGALYSIHCIIRPGRAVGWLPLGAGPGPEPWAPMNIVGKIEKGRLGISGLDPLLGSLGIAIGMPLWAGCQALAGSVTGLSLRRMPAYSARPQVNSEMFP